MEVGRFFDASFVRRESLPKSPACEACGGPEATDRLCSDGEAATLCESCASTLRRPTAREALEFYADPDSYEPQTRRVRPVIEDAGTKARAALNAPIAEQLFDALRRLARASGEGRGTYTEVRIDDLDELLSLAVAVATEAFRAYMAEEITCEEYVERVKQEVALTLAEERSKVEAPNATGLAIGGVIGRLLGRTK